ncbi:DUF7331 family protein [Halosimplex amylolyticum]|uniref:DUF7331 family protein n=1 Tax=Halosimplex amylolyticum TaxID=3396616 RepID=UPI003F5594EE
MSVRSGDDASDETGGSDPGAEPRYVDLCLESGDVIVYDRERADAWIQSAAAVDLETAV